MKSVTNKILYIIFLLVVTFFALEMLLRIFHPFPIRLKGDKIVLPQNQVYSFSNDKISKLDKNIVHTKNSLGFRGEEEPKNINECLSILTVGGSTTECLFISDNHDWSYLLAGILKTNLKNVWLNNAGLEGHSTYGHQILLDDYIVKIKPKVVLFLTGINDVGIENLRDEDRHNLTSQHRYSILSDFAYHSEVFNLIRIIHEAEDAQKMNLTNVNVELAKLDTISLNNDTMLSKIQHEVPLAHNYKVRLLKLIETCRKDNIEPILITQPCMYGSGIDSLTGVNLETIKIDNQKNGKTGWLILQLYNDQARNAGKETNTYVIDLANEMPKNSIYFYDFVHFTNAGCAKVAEIISKDISPFLKNRFSEYYLVK